MALVVVLGMVLEIAGCLSFTVRWRSNDQFRLDCRVVDRGSSDHVRDGSRDPRVALLYSGWRSCDHVMLDCRVIYRGSSDHARDGSSEPNGGAPLL